MAELRAWQPGYIDRLKYGIAGLMGDDRQSVRDAEKITSLLEYVPGVGDAMAGAEAVDAFNEGNYGTAGLLGAAAAAGLVPGVGDAAAKGIKAAVKSRGDEVLGLLKAGRAEEVTDDMLDMGNAADNANLNAYLFENYDLPMDEASRMGRAQEMGMRDSFYHETPAGGFSAFDLNKIGAAASDNEMPRGVFLKPHPVRIGVGRDTEAQMPVVANLGRVGFATDRSKLKEVLGEGNPNYVRAAERADRFDSAKARQYDRRYDGPIPGKRGDDEWNKYFEDTGKYIEDWKLQNAEMARRAQNEADIAMDALGLDSINIPYDAGSFNREVNTTVVRDPANIRSRFARFDPRLKHLRNLSAGLGGLGLLGAGSMYNDGQQEQVY